MFPKAYGPSRAFADQVLRRYGVEVEYYPPLEGPSLSKRIRDNTRLIWCESPGSITMEIQDVPAIITAAHARGVLVALDNTWGAGVLFDAFRHEIDFSVPAITKYIGGHSDLLLGSVTVRDDRDEALYKQIGTAFQHLGMVASPEDCFLALRGLQTLHVRLKAIEGSALQVAKWLAVRPEVENVLHPALPSCPGHEIWKRDFTGSSGLFSVVYRQSLSRQDLRVLMHVSSTADQGLVGPETRLRFMQKGSRVMGRYSGGAVSRGCLVGTLSGSQLVFRYAQVEVLAPI